MSSQSATAARRWLSVVRYRPERWPTGEWERAYASGQLDYFGRIDELARYSVLAGYVRYFGGRPQVLDLGCGQGLLRRQLDGAPLARYTGVDLSSMAVERAATLDDELSSFLCGDLMELELSPADVVVLNEVLYFASDPPAMLERARSLMRPGGHLLVSIWRHPGDRHLWRQLAQRFELVDRIRVKNAASPLARRGWDVACYADSARRS